MLLMYVLLMYLLIGWNIIAVCDYINLRVRLECGNMMAFPSPPLAFDPSYVLFAFRVLISHLNFLLQENIQQTMPGSFKNWRKQLPKHISSC